MSVEGEEGQRDEETTEKRAPSAPGIVNCEQTRKAARTRTAGVRERDRECKSVSYGPETLPPPQPL